jgi:hypothetical protein
MFDLAHDRPRAAIAVGDVDTADHVAVFTPGMESDVAGDLRRYTDDMREMRKTALNELRNAGRDDETVAAVPGSATSRRTPQWTTCSTPITPSPPTAPPNTAAPTSPGSSTGSTPPAPPTRT